MPLGARICTYHSWPSLAPSEIANVWSESCRPESRWLYCLEGKSCAWQHVAESSWRVQRTVQGIQPQFLCFLPCQYVCPTSHTHYILLGHCSCCRANFCNSLCLLPAIFIIFREGMASFLSQMILLACDFLVMQAHVCHSQRQQLFELLYIDRRLRHHTGLHVFCLSNVTSQCSESLVKYYCGMHELPRKVESLSYNHSLKVWNSLVISRCQSFWPEKCCSLRWNTRSACICELGERVVLRKERQLLYAPSQG